jgi:hypothetical protein
LDEELVPPAVETLECVGRRHVKHEHATVGAAVKRHSQTLETLLAGCVPDLQIKMIIKMSQCVIYHEIKIKEKLQSDFLII